MIKIKSLDLVDYKGEKYVFAYQTKGYYDLLVSESTFQFVYKEYSELKTKSFQDELVADWLEQPVLFGAFKQNILAGFIEGSMEVWNNRFRISNILVFEEYRKSQIGTTLMEYILSFAHELNARMVVLETQSCNLPAIDFYTKNGFKIIGFDTHSYSNCDMKDHHIRIEMGIEL